jgi:hypothetical protein
MNHIDYFYISKEEKKYFTKLFYERSNERNEILYSEFKEIVYSYKKFDENTTKNSIEKIKRKNSISSLTEGDMLISKLNLKQTWMIISISLIMSQWSTRRC